jgi:hypothetical protein
MKNLMNISTTDGSVWVDIAYIVTIRDRVGGGSVMTLHGGEALMCTSGADTLAMACYETQDEDNAEYPPYMQITDVTHLKG